MAQGRSLTIARACAILVSVLALAVASCTRDARDEPPAVIGPLWTAERDGARLIVYLTEEERSKSVPVGDGAESGSRFDPYSRFYLVTRRIPEGTVVDSAHLGDVDDATDARKPRIIGIVGDVVWLWRDSLEGRSLRGLGVAATVGTLTKGALEAPAPLPTEPDGYAVRSDPVALIARGRDARFYTLDAVRQRIDPLDPGSLPATTFSTRVEDRFDYLVPPGRSRSVTHVYNAMQRSFLTSTGLWYALLSESERAQQSKWPSGESHPSGDVARHLYRAPYRLDDRKQPEIDPARLTPVGSERLLQAGFLVRYQGWVWDVADPSSSLVLAKRSLGSAEPWEVVRLARDGSVVWRTSTGLEDPGEVLDLGTHIGFFGRQPATAGGVERLQRLVWIDQRTGVRRTLSIATGEVTTDDR